MFARAFGKDDFIEDVRKELLSEIDKANAQAARAEAYRQMPADLRDRAKEWGVSAIMEAVWLNAWNCGYRQSCRDRAATEGSAE
jgi:hypothetical protein